MARANLESKCQQSWPTCIGTCKQRLAKQAVCECMQTPFGPTQHTRLSNFLTILRAPSLLRRANSWIIIPSMSQQVARRRRNE
jgi:hypothetical protein